MTFGNIDKDTNALTITDAEVAENWRYGMVRSAARLLASSGSVEGVFTAGYGPFQVRAGSDAEHLYGDTSEWKSKFSVPRHKCKIVEVYEIKDATSIRYVQDSFGPGDTYNDAGFTAVIVCEHGQRMDAEYMDSMSDLLRSLTV